jgi:hypothetical protein
VSKLKHCTEEHCQQVLDFTISFARMVGLPHHWIKISGKPAQKGALAEIKHEDQRYLATIHLGRDWREISEFERFHSAVHEVCHMLHRRVETAVCEAEDLMHDHEWNAYKSRFNLEVELMVDQLALTFCDMAEVRALWYGPDAIEHTDPEAGIVPAASA